MEEKIIIIFKNQITGQSIDLEIPLNLSATELINGLNKGFDLGIDMDNPSRCYLRSKNPTTLIRGEVTLEEIGLRNGTIIYFDGVWQERQ
ncbi:WXG100 protein secretion system (Wss), protein YukD [Butyrivibrio fibrisolvens]|uniref:WXG100 protein secretion system (Wss), protein YukD n=1 Tax=Butyrivibrio fibrisolvens TaxID=831 RepID=A0A1H9KFS1_BUTFI|nr:EsaB/YukD family protein [Butyrivibrio fibrisolvens]SEQ97962.1 WXG100 protein secretion system (Wss), protein YukD [Butyrivibrio fibrisolvens]